MLKLSLLLLCLLSLIATYLLGFKQGYEIAKIEIESKLADTLNKSLEKITTPTPVPTPLPTSPTKENVKRVTWGGPDLWKVVNQKRVEYGVNPLIQKDELCTIASIRLNELLELGKLDGHEGFANLKQKRPDLSWIFERYSTIAEFLAMGGKTPEETVSLWENTLAHKKLLSGGEYVWGCIYAQNTFAVAIAAF